RGPFFEEYGTFVWRIVHGDLGESFTTRQDVTEIIAQAAPVTASLILGAAVVWLLIALPIGILSAYRPRSLLDRASMAFVLAGVSLHPLWIGYMLSWYFGFKLRWLPVNGYCDVFNTITSCGGPVQWAYHLLLPWLTFSLGFAALYARMVRASVLETLHEDYVRTARAKGLSEWFVLRSHVLRNAMLPVVTMIGMDLSLAFAGAVFVERVYGLPGIGSLLFNALGRRDMPVILGVVVLVTTAILIANLVVDLLYAVLDPRVRLHERSPRQVRTAQPVQAETTGAPAVAAP
ncbi:MAG: ABC transporter permease, partial [Actinobacteria bacterium]|nr:ABC transporter permease [Actinomycetota bacterium]